MLETIKATLAKGWRERALDDKRLILIHADHPPRYVEIASVREGDVLPRETDQAVDAPVGIGGY